MSWIFPLSGSGLCSMQLCVCVGGRIAFHIWRKQMCAFLELALRFRAVIVSVSTSEKTHASTHLSLFCFFALNPLRWVWDLSEVLRRVQIIFFFFFFPPTMGDIEAPDSNRPRQSVLLSILPTKEFATSRKGSLLIAEVVRNDRRRNHR